MAYWVSGDKTVSYRLDAQRWITLSWTGTHHWHVQIWGPEPFMADFEDLTFEEAQYHARGVIANYLRHVNPKVKVPPLLPWCTAVAVRKFVGD